MKQNITIAVLVVALIIGLYFLLSNITKTSTVENEPVPTETEVTDIVTDTPEMSDDSDEEVMNEAETVIGSSFSENDITAYHYGNGSDEVLFVGGIHGGYSWNTNLVAYELMDYLEDNPSVIPDNVKVTVIPTLNPDGLEAVVGTTGRFSASDVPASETETIPGRFNGRDVDLNRNFDCEWKSNAVWQSRSVSGGSAPFSEPEAQAVRTYIDGNNIVAAVVWYSAAGGVYASTCHNGIAPETTSLMNTFASASGYSAYDSFDYYEITGDMVNWMAGEDIPAISVLLTTHKDVEWSKNKAGIDAVLKSLAN